MTNPQQTSYCKWKPESFSSKTRKKTRMHTHTTFFQHSIRSPSHSSNRRKRQSHPKRKEDEKLPSFADDMILSQFNSVQLLSHVQLFMTPRIAAHQTCQSSQWCHSTISSSVVPFSSCPQSFPVSGSFRMTQLFAWGGLSTGVSASATVLPMNTQD